MKWLADENFSGPVLRRLREKKPDLDLVRVQDTGLRTLDDPTILEWAAQNQRVLLTHDVKTMPDYAYDRVKAGLPMPGVVEVPDSLPIGTVIDEILYLDECGKPQDFENRVEFLPV